MIIAQTYNVDPSSAHGPLSFVVALRECPFPGDIIKLRDNNREIRVLRRAFNELDADADDQVDVILGVRLA